MIPEINNKTNDQLKRWNVVYSKNKGILPWTNIPFSEGLNEYLRSLNKDDLLLISGCGTGETVNNLSKLDFSKIIGTDISDEAIKLAKGLYPKLNFKVLRTEDLKDEKNLRDSNVIDWLNLHQITPESLSDYLSSLAMIAKSICISWIYQEDVEKVNSYVHEGEVYFHNPTKVSEFLIKFGFKIQNQTKFQFVSRADKPVTHDAVTQIYAKS